MALDWAHIWCGGMSIMVVGRGDGMVICYCPYRALVWHGCGIF